MRRFDPEAKRGRDRDELRQKKSLGQVFLKTDWPVLRMVQKLEDMKIERVLEIGPGGGILTRELLAKGFKVTAVEKDDRFAQKLGEFKLTRPEDAPGSLDVVNEDILRFDWEGWILASGERSAVIGNIPYNISSPIVLRGLGLIAQLPCMMFMTQLEFAQRVIARPGTKDFGSLTVFAQLRADITLEYKVERGCFQPVPKVDSAVILILPKREQLPADVLLQAEQVTRAAFTQRRKKLRNAVKQFLQNTGEEGCPIDLERRPDALAPREFVQLAEFLVAKRK